MPNPNDPAFPDDLAERLNKSANEAVFCAERIQSLNKLLQSRIDELLRQSRSAAWPKCRVCCSELQMEHYGYYPESRAKPYQMRCIRCDKGFGTCSSAREAFDLAVADALLAALEEKTDAK